MISVKDHEMIGPDRLVLHKHALKLITYWSSQMHTRQFWENCNARPAYVFFLLISWNAVSLSPLRNGNSRRSPYVALSVTALIGLVTLTVDLFTSKQVHGLHIRWAYIVPILDFIDLSVVELGRDMRQTVINKYRWDIICSDFLPISHYIWETIQYIAIVTMEGE